MNNKHTIIIKKKSKQDSNEEDYGEGWKIAYADFITTMMAFFLLLWLIEVINEDKREQIANYFSRKKSSNLSKQMINNISKEQESKIPFFDSINNKIRIHISDDIKLIRKSLTPDQKMEQKNFESLAKNIGKTLSDNEVSGFNEKNTYIEINPEGLKIQLLDSESYSMFPAGSNILYPNSIKILEKIVKIIKSSTNKIKVSVHTDAQQHNSPKNYGNWELSSDRANSVRRVLEEKKISSKRFISVIGKASSSHLETNNLLSNKNRRISILLLREHSFPSKHLSQMKRMKVE